MYIPDHQRLLSSSFVKKEAGKLGFFDCGISKAARLDDDELRMERWLDEGMQGEMSYLERNKEKRYNPAKLVKDAKSVISVLFAYSPKEKLPETNNYKISTYAYGVDYHRVVKDKLYQLLHIIEEKTRKRNARIFVDSAPVLDRAWAHKSGLGFIGKNTMLINRKGGSFFFIGHIIIDLELEYDQNVAEKNFCGSCTLCIDTCPTKALEPFQLDARKCISYLTIENKKNIPVEFKNKFNNWIFGCDICQEVCPWNRKPEIHHEPLFRLTEELIAMRKNDWQSLSKKQFDKLFKSSAVKRVGFEGLKRNIRYLEE